MRRGWAPKGSALRWMSGDKEVGRRVAGPCQVDIGDIQRPVRPESGVGEERPVVTGRKRQGRRMPRLVPISAPAQLSREPRRVLGNTAISLSGQRGFTAIVGVLEAS